MSNKENKHTLLKVLGVTAVAGASAYAGAGYYVSAMRLIYRIVDIYKNVVQRCSYHYYRWKEMSGLHTCNRFDDFIDSYDGLKLHALRIVNQEDSHKWIISTWYCLL